MELEAEGLAERDVALGVGGQHDTASGQGCGGPGCAGETACKIRSSVPSIGGALIVVGTATDAMWSEPSAACAGVAAAMHKQTAPQMNRDRTVSGFFNYLTSSFQRCDVPL